MTQPLKDFVAAYLTEKNAHGAAVSSDLAIESMARRLIATGRVPDNILEALPEVSRDNYPQDSPQEYECGCVTVVRVTDRNPGEKPFEMRLALLCKSDTCELACLR